MITRSTPEFNFDGLYPIHDDALLATGPITLPPSESVTSSQEWQDRITATQDIAIPQPSPLPPADRWEDGRPVFHQELTPTTIGSVVSGRTIRYNPEANTCTSGFTERTQNYLAFMQHVLGMPNQPLTTVAGVIAQSQAEAARLNSPSTKTLPQPNQYEDFCYSDAELSEISIFGHHIAALRRDVRANLQQRQKEQANIVLQPHQTHQNTTDRLTTLLEYSTAVFGEQAHPVLANATSSTNIHAERSSTQGTYDEATRILLRNDATSGDYLRAVATGLTGFESPALQCGAAIAITEDLMPGSTQNNQQQKLAGQLFQKLLEFGVPLHQVTRNIAHTRSYPITREVSAATNERLFFDAISERTGIDMALFIRTLSGSNEIAITPTLVKQLDRLLSILPDDITTADPTEVTKRRNLIQNRSRRAIRKFLTNNKADSDGVFLVALRKSLDAEARFRRTVSRTPIASHTVTPVETVYTGEPTAPTVRLLISRRRATE